MTIQHDPQAGQSGAAMSALLGTGQQPAPPAANPLTGSNATASNADPAVTGKAPGNSQSNLFITLLVSQIQNQDPLSPSDPSQFVNQLAQLSQVEAAQQMAEQGKTNGATLTSLQGLIMGQQIGHTVMVNTHDVDISKAPLTGKIQLKSAAKELTLTLTSDTGQSQQVKLGEKPSGSNDFSIDPAKLGLAPGRYHIQALTDAQESPDIELAGTLQSIRLAPQGGAPFLTVTGLGEVSANQVSRLGNTAANAV